MKEICFVCGQPVENPAHVSNKWLSPQKFLTASLCPKHYKEMTIPPSAHNNRIKYAWCKWMGYSTPMAKNFSQRTQMPAQFYADLEKWFYYHKGKLYFDPTQEKHLKKG